MKVNEIFYSLQGEGMRTGVPSIFIRLSGCKAKFACAANGIVCDTEFESGREMTPEEITAELAEFPCREIIWTGGEPLDQITLEVFDHFHKLGYLQCVETSGLHPLPVGTETGWHWVVVSPKVADHIVKKNFPSGVNELRYVRHKGQSIPEPLISAEYNCISPHSDGNELNMENVNYCIDLCLKNPIWNLSIQQHKILQIR